MVAPRFLRKKTSAKSPTTYSDIKFLGDQRGSIDQNPRQKQRQNQLFPYYSIVVNLLRVKEGLIPLGKDGSSMVYITKLSLHPFFLIYNSMCQ